MSDDKVEINERMGMKDHFEDTLGALDDLEKKIDEVNKDIPSPDKMSMHPPLTREDKIRMINMLFPISLGDKVKNKHGEEGYVETVAIDKRGVIYLINYKKHNTIWESSYQIEKISPYFATESDHIGEDRSKAVKTDIPDPNTKTHTVGDRKSEME